MSFLKNLFGGKKEETKEVLVTVSNGELVKISEVPDEVFSSKMMGDGFAQKTSDGVVVSPVDGKVVTIFPTKHALTMLSKGGMEILIHLGVDTVNLKGEGFETLVCEGQEVRAGEELVKMDIDFINENAKSSMPIIVFTNLAEDKSVQVFEGTVKLGESGKIEIN
ncbi:MAG: PTS glucose transporter subunit IIA [Peptostreptococcaceae bacterium]